MKLPAQDKLAHFAVGLMLALFLALLFPLKYALFASVLIAGGKEIYDSFDREHHTPDIWDFAVTVAGALYAIILLWLMQLELGTPHRPIFERLTDPAATSYAESL